MIFRFIFIFLVGLSLVRCTHLKEFSLPRKSSTIKVGVIVGSGGARTISALGVLKELQDRQISIDAIVGIGWGAWVAGLYAQNKSVDEVRWSFHKLSQRGLFNSSFLKKRSKSVQDLDTDIEENFKFQSQIPFACPVLTSTGERMLRSEKFLRNCLILPPFFKLESESGSLFSIKEAISFLKNKGVNVVVWVDPLDSEGLFSKDFPDDLKWVWQEARFYFSNMETEKGVYRLSPNLKGYHLLDFSKINLIYEESLKQAPFLLKILQEEFPYLSI